MLWLTLACAEAGPWYAKRKPCPEGATLYGEPHDGPVRAPDEGTLVRPGPEVWCGTGEGFQERHGPFTGWWANGQLGSEAVYEHGTLVELKAWNAQGHLEAELLPDGNFRRLWTHPNGQVGVEGAFAPDHAPVGDWVEYDEAGVEVGRVTWTAGQPGELEGTSRLVLFAEQADGVSWVAEGLELPRTTSTRAPVLAVNLVLTPEQLVIDGVPVLRLDQRRIPEDEKRGMVVTKAYDRLLEKRETAMALAVAMEQDTPHEILFQVDASTPWSEVAPLMVTAGQSQFSEFHLLGDTGLQWPPRSGPLPGEKVGASVVVRLPAIGPDVSTPPMVVLGETWRVTHGHEARVFTDRAEAVAYLDTVGGVELVVAPTPELSWGEVMAALDQVRGAHPELVLASAPASPPPP